MSVREMLDRGLVHTSSMDPAVRAGLYILAEEIDRLRETTDVHSAANEAPWPPPEPEITVTDEMIKAGQDNGYPIFCPRSAKARLTAGTVSRIYRAMRALEDD